MESFTRRCFSFYKTIFRIFGSIKFWLFFQSFPENKKTDISIDTWTMLLEFHYVTKGNKANYDPSGK